MRHPRSQKFLKSTGHWTRRAEAACNFPNMVNAIHTCLASGAKEVDFILRFEGDTHDRCLPVVCA
ncbi:MAG TPA: hypothetical protein VK327_17090 [Candidatus Paceibacterota bacterium]|nr:hypothetical protein [Candidatus Paceibacterota bacterium]